MRFCSLSVVFAFGRFLAVLKYKALIEAVLMWVMVSDWMRITAGKN